MEEDIECLKKAPEQAINAHDNILLGAERVNVIMRLIDLKAKIDTTQNELQEAFDDRSNKIKSCLDLVYELRFIKITILWFFLSPYH